MSTPLEERPLVLVVDDQEDSRELVIMLLQTGELRAIGAEGAAAALSLAAKEPPAVIITDIRMPGIDGWTFIDQLKHNEATRGIPVIVMTADTQDAAMLKALAGGSTFFPKPFVNADLLHEATLLAYDTSSRNRRSRDRANP